MTGCLHESYSIWNAVILLEEADLTPEDLPAIDQNIALLKDVWAYLVENEGSFKDFRRKMESDNSESCMGRWLASKTGDSGSRRVIIDGFYYFTPIQERIIRAIIRAGYEPIFIIPYREEHPFANQIWTDYYGTHHGFDPKEKWESIGYNSINECGELLEGRAVRMVDVHLKEYRNVMGMVDDLRGLNGKTNLYSPNVSGANSILQDFFPERYGLKKLSSYPVGAFIRTLHFMWDDKTQSLILDDDLLMDAFVSGWVSSNGISSDMVISDLEKVLPFFRGCSSIETWHNRSHLLNTIHNSVMSHFQPDSDNPEDRRWLRVLDDPLGNFGVFDVERDRVELIIDLIDNLSKCARFLFGNGEERSMSAHFGRLLKILQDNGTSEAQKEELSIATEYLLNLSNHTYSEKYYPADIINALLLFLDNEIPVDEDDNSTDWVKPLYDINGNEGPLHLCLCDHRSLPGVCKGYVWPLTDELMESIRSRQAEKDNYPLIDNLTFIIRNNPVLNRYLVYSAFDSGPVTISWVSTDNGKKLAPSPYIALISRICNAEISTFKTYDVSSAHIEDTSCGAHLLEPAIIPDGHRIPEVNIDTALCHRRYLYGYILDDRPSFKSDFHYGFAIGGLISALREVQKAGGFPKEKIDPSVFTLFPFLSKVEQRNILDLIPQSKFNGHTRYNDVQFTDVRLGIHFPQPLWEMIDERLGNLELEKPISILEATPSVKGCMYCSFTDKCPYSMFSCDSDDR